MTSSESIPVTGGRAAARRAAAAGGATLGERAGGGGSGGPNDGEPGGGAPGGGGRRADRRRSANGRRKRWIRWVALTTGVVLVTGCGAGYLYYRHLNANIQAGSKNLSDEQGARTAPDAKGRTPLNILLLGTDSRGSKENVDLGGSADEADRPGLADVQMLLHVSADRSNASLIVVPRDSMVDMPACRGEDGKEYKATRHTQINEALARGGPGCVVGTWIKLTGLDIDHYMMVDFSGVVRMADAIGGVPVCVNMNMYDRYQPGIGGTDLKLPKGTTPLKGEDALKWLRVRDAWGSDIGRTKAQRMYLSSMLRQLRSSGRLTDPGELMGLAEAATKSLSVDRPLADVRKLYDLGGELRSVPPERITTLTIPWKPDPANSAKVQLKEPDAGQVWKMLLADAPLDGKGPVPAPGASDAASPGAAGASAPAGGAPAGGASAGPAKGPVNKAVAVTVQNASGATNRATEVKGALTAAGFTKAVPASAAVRSTTELLYGNGLRAEAEAVAAALKLPDGALKESAGTKGVTVVIGKDWPSGTTFAGPASQPVPTELPKAADSSTSDVEGCMEVNPQGGIYTWK
ncbi:LCP family protein [Kitasatospora camelliae]|uniref:LCP family protein n=1 Tax=Kitasatospora camelliae TaxID=3156397 RepID=A0AAU8JVQ3_9ACTN